MKQRMKWMGVGLGLLAGLLGARSVSAQEETEKVLVEKAGIVEEFSVLKADRTIRQGAYIRYRPLGGAAGVAVLEAGSYEHGLKEGEWRSFYEEAPWNKLQSQGSYRAGLPDGLWQYYHCYWMRQRNAAELAPNGRKTKAGYLVSVVDSAARLQAKGLNYAGTRAGVWVYYDAAGNAIQKVNEAAHQLVYWRPPTREPVSGPALGANHPLLYLGGRNQLQDAIYHHIEAFSRLQPYSVGSAKFVFSVDSTGHQTHFGLDANVLPNAFETFVLSALSNLPTTWLPQVVNGHAVAAEYRVRLSIKNHQDSGRLTVEMLGD
ncbi:toxin-antitoxin system YwqK family antitoxin [Hymenobacter monticola]|uniref:TonB C-terminal domain-containing protein n=1 Tax=Hymenobacter monticola TaxID=1705399 RepID=A0ABY4AZF2_9BACT|nr:hypothetical protein [Hymenobacter monticola]UOE32283.1 hypothetical protein MTP16_14200 [Hymenobacter monticola]